MGLFDNHSISEAEWQSLLEHNVKVESMLAGIDQKLSALLENTVTTEEMAAAFLKQERWLYDEMERHERLSANRDAKTEIRLKDLCREGGETQAQADRRLFRRIEPASGIKRDYQLATARLMGELDNVLGHLGIDYWFSFGTLLASHYRSGAIPWDDDIDAYLLREDIDRLRAYLDSESVAGNEESVGHGYQVTVAYDFLAKCKQVRFSSQDDGLPCFIDLAVMEKSCGRGEQAEHRMRELRLELADELGGREDLSYWREHPFLYAPESGRCVQVTDDGYDDVDPKTAAGQIRIIEDIMAKYNRIAVEEGLLVGKDGSWKGVAHGLDQITAGHYIWDRADIYPTGRETYESYEFSVPADAERVCQDCYPGSPYLPDDIVGHDHLSLDGLSNGQVAAIRRYAAG